MDEEFAGEQPDNLIGGHSTIRTTNPKVAGGLLLGQFLEKGGIPEPNALRPLAILAEQIFDGGHRSGQIVENLVRASQ
jgi:hypothetical protein